MEQLDAIFERAELYVQLITPLRFEYANNQVKLLSESLGFGHDQLKYILCLLGAYPLAMIYRTLPTASTKHLFDVIVGILIAQFVFSTQWIHSFLCAFITYFLVKFGPAKYAPQISFAFNMIYMSASHIYRLYVDYMGWSLDFTGPQMILVIKLTSFAFNYYDGVVDRVGEKKNLSPSQDRLYASRNKYALTKLPSLLEFFGYVYSYTTFLAGPAFEIREYLDSTTGAKFMYQGKIIRPSCTLSVLMKLGQGLIFMVVFAAFAPNFPSSNVYSDEVAVLPLMQRVLTIYATLYISIKLKYFSAWKIAEGSAVLSGFGFEGFDAKGNPKGWNAVSNMDVIGFETAQSMRDGSRSWNMCTQSWLERYVYTRTGNSLIATYFVSAFWHGFYPGYYFFFMSIPLATAVARVSRKRLRPYFLNADGSEGWLKKIYDFLSLIINQCAMHYLVLPFIGMSWELSMKAWSNTYFIGHICFVVCYVVFSLVPIRKMNIKKQ